MSSQPLPRLVGKSGYVATGYAARQDGRPPKSYVILRFLIKVYHQMAHPVLFISEKSPDNLSFGFNFSNCPGFVHWNVGECPICHETAKLEVKTNCGHSFCGTCIFLFYKTRAIHKLCAQNIWNIFTLQCNSIETTNSAVH